MPAAQSIEPESVLTAPRPMMVRSILQPVRVSRNSSTKINPRPADLLPSAPLRERLSTLAERSRSQMGASWLGDNVSFCNIKKDYYSDSDFRIFQKNIGKHSR